MALSSWAEALVPVVANRLSALGINPANAPIFAAQLDLETGGGKSSLARRANNYAGIGGLGNYRHYASPSDGVQGYLDLLSNSKHYQPVIQAARTGGVEDVARALGNSPWAAGRYRLGVAGNEDVRGVRAHPDGTWGTVGTEGAALLAKLGKPTGGYSGGGSPGTAQASPAVDYQAFGRHMYGQLVSQGMDPSQYNFVFQGTKGYVVPKQAA